MDKFTDQYFTYRETPVDYDGVGNITRIKGNTLVWNQLHENQNGQNAIAQYANMLNVGSNFSVPSGHKLLVMFTQPTGCEVYSQSRTGFDANYTLYPTVTTPTVRSFIGTTTATVTASQFNGAVSLRTAVETAVRLTNCMIFDLTQMGLDSITDPSDFTSLYPLSYYPYDSGSLLSFNGTGIKTQGANFISMNQSPAQAQNLRNVTVNEQTNESVTVTSTGTGTYAGIGLFYKLKAGTYTFKYQAEASDSFTPTMTIYNGSTIFRSANVNTAITFTLSEELTLEFRFFATTTTAVRTVKFYNVMLQLGSTATDFEPYKENTTSLPIQTYFPTGMKSAENVYDEQTPNKAVTMVGNYTTAGTDQSSWALTGHYGSYSRFDNNNVKAKVGTTNFISNMFSLITIGSSNEGMAFHGGDGHLIIQIETSKLSADSPSGLMSYFASHPFSVNYELATPTEQDINISMFYPVYANGTEQILPTSDTSPFFGDIEYYNGTEGETNIRKFWLINGENERWNLTEKDFKAFLNNPQGLGFKKTVESVRYGERQNKVSETYNFPQPQGELLFYDSYNSTRYDKYNKFIRFLMNQPITLYYMIPVSYISGIANIYTLDCEVTEVQKTESKTDNILRSSIVFSGMEFYKGDPITVNGTGTSYTLTNEGDFPVGFEITIEGNLTNPYVTLSQDEELYGEAKFDSETAFNSLYINSNDGEQNVILEQCGAVIPNPLSYQDLSISNGSIYVTFVKLARGESTLTIGMDSGSITGVTIKYTPKYRSV